MPVLVALRHLGKANVFSYMKWFVRASIPNRCRPGSGGLLPLSGVTRRHRPEWAHLLAYVGAALLVVGVPVLGIGNQATGALKSLRRH